jgi:hypothetical protein
MTHPVIIMSYDKSPAIIKAVAALEEAGLEVTVLNTATAKLVNFLGALAGEDTDEDNPADAEDAPADDTPPENEDEPPAEEEPAPEEGADKIKRLPDEEEEEPLATEAVINDETVLVEIVDGAGLTLLPSSITIAAKTFYTLNESQFSFWPAAVANEPIKGGVQLELLGVKQFATVTFGDSAAVATLQIGREWLKEASYPKNSWAVLPAAKAIFDKNKVTPDEVDAECNHGAGKGQVMIVQRTSNKYPDPAVSIVMMPGQGTAYKLGSSSDAHHDQSFARLGQFTVIGFLKKDGDEWKLEADKKIPGLETPEQIKKFKAPLFVFK